MIGAYLALFASLFWGLNGVFLRKGLEGRDVISGTITVVSTTSAILLVISIPDMLRTPTISPNNLAMLFLAGLVSYFFGRLFTYSSVASIGSSRAFSGTSTRIAFSALLGILLLKERAGPDVIAGVALMTLGLYIFSTEDVSREGIYSSVLGGFAYGFAALLVKVAMLPSPVMTSLVVSLSGLIALCAFAKLKGKDLVTPNRFLLASGSSLALGNVFYYYALSISPISIVVPLSNLYPLVTTALSFLLIQKLELVTPRTFLGSFLAVLGSVIILT